MNYYDEHAHQSANGTHEQLAQVGAHNLFLLDAARLTQLVRGSDDKVRTATQIGNHLPWNRSSTPSANFLEVNTLLTDTANILQQLCGSSHTLVVAPEAASSRVNADPMQVQLVLYNLVINALDAMPEGGRLIIRTSALLLGELFSRENFVRPGRYVLIQVSDTGCGIDPQVRPHIFDPFFTTKKNGLGLGLTIVRSVVDELGGFMTVRSREGFGTTLGVYLPAFEPGVGAEQVKEAAAQPVV